MPNNRNKITKKNKRLVKKGSKGNLTKRNLTKRNLTKRNLTKRNKRIIKTTISIDSLGLMTNDDHAPTIVRRIQIFNDLKKGGDCGCGKNKFIGGENTAGLSPVPFTVPQQNMIPFNKADNLANYSLSARNINGGKKTMCKQTGCKQKGCKQNGCKHSNKQYENRKKGGSIMNMFNSASNVVTGASSNGVLSFGTIPGAETATKILYGVPLNNPSTWVQPVQQVYGQHNSPMV